MKSLISIFLGIFATNVLASTPMDQMVEKIIHMRQQVEVLNSEYKLEKEAIMSEIKSLSVQKAELASQIRSEEIRQKQLGTKISKNRKEMGQQVQQAQSLAPLLHKYIGELKTWIQNSMPMKTSERMQALESLESKIESKDISITKGTQLLWGLYQDELRLVKEVQLNKQTISINGEMKMATLAKVGGLFLFFKTDDGRTGRALQVSALDTKKSESVSKWAYQAYSPNSLQEKQIRALFDSLKKQIRQGAFRLPTLQGASI